MAESDLSAEVSATTVLPSPSSLSTSVNENVDLSWANKDDSPDGSIDVERSTDGFTTVTTVVSGLQPSTTSYTDTSVSEGTYEYRVKRNTDHATATSVAEQVSIFLNTSRSIISHSSTGEASAERLINFSTFSSSHGTAGSSSIRVVDLIESVSSGSNSISAGADRDLSLVSSATSSASLMSSSAERIITISVGADSHATSSGSTNNAIFSLVRLPASEFGPLTSSSERGGASYEDRQGEASYSDNGRSFSYNERTSLELIDRNLNWNDEKAFWITDWFQEARILGSEDNLAIRSVVVDSAKDPAATVEVQYDKSGDGEVDATSDKIELDTEQEVQEISGVPIDENGYYRLKIMEYSGYNSLYVIDTAIVN